MEKTIKVLGTVERRKFGSRGQHVQFRAKVGDVEVDAATSEGAVQGMAERIVALCSESARPIVMPIPTEPGAIMLGTRTPWGGWGYTFFRLRETTEIADSMREGGSCFGWATRDECEERMRVHWYQIVIEPVVNGIVALCTDRRQFVCSHCHTVTTSGAPYKCSNPQCRDTVRRAA